MQRILTGTLVLSLLLSGATASAQLHNLVQNGGFETGPDPGTFSTIGPGQSFVPGWTVVKGTVDYVGREWNYHPGGQRSIDLNGTPGIGGIVQNVPTTPGQMYRLSFDVGGNFGCGNTTKTLGVVIDGRGNRYTYTRQGSEHPGRGKRYFVDFVASRPQTELLFESLTTDSEVCGPVLDNVSVVSMSENTTQVGESQDSYRPAGTTWLSQGPDTLSSGNLVRNGSFELGKDPGGFTTLHPGERSVIEGWEVTRQTVDYIGSHFPSADGNRHVDLDGSPGIGGVRQAIATRPGQKYRLTFDLAGNPQGAPQYKRLGVKVNDHLAVFTHDASTNWTRQSLEFTATQPQTDLEFFSLDQPDGKQCGPLLDNVQVTESHH